MGPDENGEYLPEGKRNADALFEISSMGLAESPDTHKSKRVVHADLAKSGASANGPRPWRQSKRWRMPHLSGAARRKTIGSGRATRLFPPKVQQAIFAHDQGCRWVGCHRRRWIQTHHVKEWDRDF